MSLRVRWMGVDLGECLMDVTPRRGHLLIGDTTRVLGQPEKSAERCHRWRILIEKYGSLPVVLESHKVEMLDYVFDGDPAAGEAYLDVEQDYLRLAAGAHEALDYLRGRGIELSVVTAAKTSPSAYDESSEFRFLLRHDVAKYFDSVISPRGRIRLDDRSVDERYLGTTKEEGTIYQTIAEDLATRGIAPEEAVMMGDKEWTDISPAKKEGFKTILYAGYVRRGPTEADAVIEHFSDLIELVGGPRNGE